MKIGPYENKERYLEWGEKINGLENKISMIYIYDLYYRSKKNIK
tara:strand:+ start:3420 stop:3551 length:132 start_codon:yes stop_codon:yes gene_type:complete